MPVISSYILEISFISSPIIIKKGTKIERVLQLLESRKKSVRKELQTTFNTVIEVLMIAKEKEGEFIDCYKGIKNTMNITLRFKTEQEMKNFISEGEEKGLL